MGARLCVCVLVQSDPGRAGMLPDDAGPPRLTLPGLKPEPSADTGEALAPNETQTLWKQLR